MRLMGASLRDCGDFGNVIDLIIESPGEIEDHFLLFKHEPKLNIIQGILIEHLHNQQS